MKRLFVFWAVLIFLFFSGTAGAVLIGYQERDFWIESDCEGLNRMDFEERGYSQEPEQAFSGRPFRDISWELPDNSDPQGTRMRSEHGRWRDHRGRHDNPAPVPEPSTLSLVMAGLTAFGFFAARTAKRKS